MRKFFAVFWALILFVPAVSFAASEADIRAAIGKSITTGERITHFKIANMCGGTAAVVNEFADYWVFDGQVFAANGVAMGLSPKASMSPPSVEHSGIMRALAGEKVAPKPNMGIYYATFLQDVFKQATAAKLPIKKEGYLGLVLKTKSGLKATVETSESCGMLTKVTVLADYVIDGKDNDKTMILPMLIVPAFLAPDMTEQERLDILGKAMEQAAKKKGEYATFTLGNTQCQLIYLADGKKKGRFALEAKVAKN